MASNELTARIRFDTKSAAKSVDDLVKRVDKLNNKMANAPKQSAREQKLRQQLEREIALVDKKIAKETDALRKQQAAKWKSFTAEQASYDKQLAKVEQLKQKELEKERIRQQSLNTITATDRAAQRMVASAEQQKRAEYEAWWQAQLLRQEFQRSHPVLSRVHGVWEKITGKIQQALANHPKLNNAYNKVHSKVTQIKSKIQEWWAKQRNVLSITKQTNTVFGSIWNKLKGIAATYLGIMGTRALIQTSDTITGAQNKLNYVNSQQLGASGVNANGAYSAKTIQMTQESMDKMYVSAQKVRMSYTDMMSNVSKSMVLAGDAFQNSTDNAIRFQEIMAEAYAIGGASAQEMSSSMYQMIQALGAGTLAGDELRSVREGAPLAYQAIEEFVQGVWDTDESLKQLAADGKVTSDMVVAAIMNAGDKMDSAFAKTKVLFDQVGTQITNAFKKAFEPVSNMLRDALNEAVNNGMIQKIESAFVSVSKALQIAFKVIENGITWIMDNWSWISTVVLAGLATITVMMVASALIAAGAWLLANLQFVLIAVAIFVIIYALLLLQKGTITTSQFFLIAAAIIIAALVVIGIMMNMTWLIWVAVILAILALAFMFFEEICGGISGVVSWIGAACSNIGTFFSNLWHGATAMFWEFIGNVLTGLSDLEPAFNALASLFGLEGVTLSGLTAGAYAKADEARGKIKDYQNLGDAFDSGYQSGHDWGEGVKNSINDWGSNKLNGLTSGLNGINLDSIGESLGLTFGGFPSATDPANGVAGAYNMPDNENLLKGIKGDTGSISDSMDLTDEDLEYLRRIAEMEWKKEFTTANITVDMSNYNTINGENDLDGIVTKLADKLYEEMNVVANGVYA